MNKPEIPVLLLTGYLGSGKTTLLNRILHNRKGIRFAVIVNDIGEVNIDAELIQKGGVVGQNEGDDLVALSNGCICCTLKMDLVEQITQLADTERFDYIVIEASGICEPAPIAQTIQSIPAMGGNYCEKAIPVLDCIVTVVDALRMRDEFASGESLQRHDIEEEDIENLIIQQIEFCNVILLNKISEIDESERKLLKSIIRAIQPKAKIIECDWCDVDLDKIIGTGTFDFEDTATSATWVREVEKPIEDVREEDPVHDHHHDHDHEHAHDHDHEHENDHDHDHESNEEDGHVCDSHCHHHHHHHHHHDEEGEAEEYGIQTFVYFRRNPFSITKFDRFAAEWPRSIIRAKGVVYFKENPDMSYLFEQAGRQMSLKEAGLWLATAPKEELEMMAKQDPTILRDWDDTIGDRMIKLVIIGRNLDKKAITEGFDRCLA